MRTGIDSPIISYSGMRILYAKRDSKFNGYPKNMEIYNNADFVKYKFSYENSWVTLRKEKIIGK